jgi:hypothetical protein
MVSSWCCAGRFEPPGVHGRSTTGADPGAPHSFGWGDARAMPLKAPATGSPPAAAQRKTAMNRTAAGIARAILATSIAFGSAAAMAMAAGPSRAWAQEAEFTVLGTHARYPEPQDGPKKRVLTLVEVAAQPR